MDVTVTRATTILGDTGATAPPSAVSWGAILAGAFTAAALALMLVALGAGLGLASVSPWSNANPSGTAFSLTAAIWVTVSQLIAAAVGGYVAGRLRTRWHSVHTDEVFFRDTAHGLLVWAVGAVIGATLLTSAATSVISSGARVAALTSITAEREGTTSSYYVDMLFRTPKPDTVIITRPLPTAEVSRILAVSLRDGEMAPADKVYLSQLIASRTDLTPAEASQRIDDVIVEAKSAANKARKAGAMFAIWTAISLLVGAFAASYAATIGGRLRDRV